MLVPTRCPLGGPPEADRELYPANFVPEELDKAHFSARRRPDRIHYRMVRNAESGTLRADPILDPESIAALYRSSAVTETEAAEGAARTYARYLPAALHEAPDRAAALEIGCGHGAFLRHLRDAGFETVQGVELSADAVKKAPPDMRDSIVTEELHDGLFEPASFSLICGFQVLDHLIDPNGVLQQCQKLLKPGGVMFWICHDIGSWPARLLGERCPMIDVEHVVLYNRRTIRALFERNGFTVREVHGVSNAYPLSYWLHLAPLPDALKRGTARFLDISGAGQWQLRMNFGNMALRAINS